MTKITNQLPSRRQFLGVFAAGIPLLYFSKSEPEIIYTMEIFSLLTQKNQQHRL